MEETATELFGRVLLYRLSLLVTAGSLGIIAGVYGGVVSRDVPCLVLLAGAAGLSGLASP